MILAQALGLASAGRAAAEPLKLALWNVELDRAGPGLLARDIAGGKDAQVTAVVRVLVALDADVLLLTGFDYDHDLVAAGLLAQALAAAGAPYPHRFAFPPNAGLQTGLDLDGDGRAGGPGDAQGWGRFYGQGGMLLLSRLAVDTAAARDFSGFLWADLPGALLAPDMPANARAIQRLSSTGHWDLPLILPGGGRLDLLAWHATPPVFDGPEDRNGRRNHDETAFWLALLDGRLPALPPPPAPFVLLGTANLDPADGDGRRDAIAALLARPDLQDPRPAAGFAPADPGQSGDPALDTAVFPQTGGLRVELILPSAELRLRGAGVLRLPPEAPLAADLAAASRHFPVWVEIDLPAP
uniref:endonuclease/exonuclease/phosphatase family protein n=1 Tax=Xinfangfangia pollutisoli TaxID=2865960 RepID=UPI001CD68E31|nr:endonuclease/exonuclease/phosphatase family protein [Xinfangfangia pollutisoli]